MEIDSSDLQGKKIPQQPPALMLPGTTKPAEGSQIFQNPHSFPILLIFSMALDSGKKPQEQLLFWSYWDPLHLRGNWFGNFVMFFWRIICRPEAYILVRREVLKNLDCFWLLCKAFYGHLYLRKIQHNFMFWSIFIGIKYLLLCLSSTIN